MVAKHTNYYWFFILRMIYLFMTQLDSTPLESRDIPEGRVKDFRWSPADDEIYVLLSREGQLFSGHVGETPSRIVNNNVVAGNVQDICLGMMCYFGDK
jgi:hypothetical protein